MNKPKPWLPNKFSYSLFHLIHTVCNGFFTCFFFVASTDIIMDLSCKLQKPNVALVHQMPFYTDLPGFAGTIDKVRCLFLDIIRFNSKILT